MCTVIINIGFPIYRVRVGFFHPSGICRLSGKNKQIDIETLEIVLNAQQVISDLEK